VNEAARVKELEDLTELKGKAASRLYCNTRPTRATFAQLSERRMQGGAKELSHKTEVPIILERTDHADDEHMISITPSQYLQLFGFHFCVHMMSVSTSNHFDRNERLAPRVPTL
jgi:hypothetical protein